MSLIQTIKEEVVPLSSKQGLILYITITCVFQFVLFYAPALADDAIKQALASEIVTVDVATRNNDVQNEPLIMALATESPKPETVETKVTENRADAVLIEEAAPTATTTVETGPKVIRVSTHSMTAYNSDPRQTDDTPCITANGFNVCEHGIEDTIAANFLKFGTKVMIPELFGDRVFIVRDRMNKRYTDRVDIWMKNYDDARKFGVKTAEIHVIE